MTTLVDLLRRFEDAGYYLLGKENIAPGLLQGKVLNAPVVLIPSLPPVQKDCQMIPDALSWPGEIRGFSKVEGAATVESTGFTVVRLQFLPVRDPKPC